MTRRASLVLLRVFVAALLVAANQATVLRASLAPGCSRAAAISLALPQATDVLETTAAGPHAEASSTVASGVDAAACMTAPALPVVRADGHGVPQGAKVAESSRPGVSVWRSPPRRPPRAG